MRPGGEYEDRVQRQLDCRPTFPEGSRQVTPFACTVALVLLERGDFEDYTVASSAAAER
jgi:hypothetical protein